MNQIYKDDNFKIYHANDGYILHNYRLDGFRHSHINNYNTCIYIKNLYLHRKIPNNLPRYLLISLMRISDDEEYNAKVQELIDNKKLKERYYNARNTRRANKKS